MQARVNVEVASTDASANVEPAKSNRFLGVVRTIVVDLPLATLFLALLFIFFIQHLYAEYYPRLLDQYERNDKDLIEQQTYYHRYCTTNDLTTRDPTDLLVDTNGPVETAVDQLMTHGGVVIPRLLHPETAQQLRDYVDQRNRAIRDTEQFPMYPPENRLSYGFDATESPIVAKALQEVSTNPFFYDLMSTVLGDEDPAACELTTIASFYGAPDQGWHSDTKEFGNALKFSRSYAHTYSLFLALQNTTMPMGATEICPGTHYCANPLEELCDVNRMSLADVTGTGQIGAGDGALLSQMVWHRGAAHDDPNGPERILFIMTFLARPRHDRDPRQFAKGTYFHLKWSMWGNTWSDLRNPMEYMKPPYSFMRALGLWKPASRNWGYDMVTSLMMQLSNEMLHGDDLEKRWTPRLDAIGFPKWLRGPLLEQELDMRDAWKAYWDATIGKTRDFMLGINIFAHSLYVVFVLALSVAATMKKQGGLALFGSSAVRTSITHGPMYLLFWWGKYGLANTEWGRRVMQGTEMFDPFPPMRILKDEELAFVPTGSTTFPTADDVLIGTRFDSKWMGSYERYLDWHKGNILYRRELKEKAPFYLAYRSLPAIFQERLVEDTVRAVEDARGRFLDQDFRIGTWHIKSREEVLQKVHTDMIVQSMPIKTALARILDREIAEYRFLKLRQAAMGAKSWLHLQKIKSLLVGNHHKNDSKSGGAVPKSMIHLFSPNKPITAPGSPRENRIPAHRRFTAPPAPPQEVYRIGTKVYVQLMDPMTHRPVYYRGDIIEVSDDTPPLFTVAMETSEHIPNLLVEHLSLYTPVTEGDRVHGCFEKGFQECFPGRIVRVFPDLAVAIAYDDGDFDDRRERNMYYVERPHQRLEYPEYLTYYAPENFR